MRRDQILKHYTTEQFRRLFIMRIEPAFSFAKKVNFFDPQFHRKTPGSATFNMGKKFGRVQVV